VTLLAKDFKFSQHLGQSLCRGSKTDYLQCDSLEKCSHCPVQSFENESDFWKILGCFRKCLQDFSDIFCPGETTVFKVGSHANHSEL